MKKTFLITTVISLGLLAGCQNAATPATTPLATQQTTESSKSKVELVITSQESTDITKSNLENSLSELDLVE